ncbi:hypothetical protein HGA13_19500 [Nocardia speluncae]|uniref:Uncharacterized protein n=1 Tax=Nocardia speluncae TaxID=419477 RepID=A0A846XGI0_9NOCA|nr:hypothetical protein [Nocardia speluncae]NKY35238.1 hypothetical protein [Nocardia speluncae]
MTFIEANEFVASVAAEHGVKLSNRKRREVAKQWINPATRVARKGKGGYADPTGDTAVRNVLALLRQR